MCRRFELIVEWIERKEKQTPINVTRFQSKRTEFLKRSSTGPQPNRTCIVCATQLCKTRLILNLTIIRSHRRQRVSRVLVQTVSLHKHDAVCQKRPNERFLYYCFYGDGDFFNQ